MARILVLSQIVAYPPDAGPKVKTLQVLRHLAEHHDLAYCAFARTAQEARDAAYLSDFCRRVVTVPLSRSRASDMRFMLQSLASNEAFFLQRDERAEMRAVVRRLLAEATFDVIHVDQLNMMRYVPPDWAGIVVLDEHNAVWQRIDRLRANTREPVRKWLLGREARKVREFEQAACQRAQLVLAVSEHDRSALQDLAGSRANIKVVPIAVQAADYDAVLAQRAPQPNRLLTIGTMFSPPNSEGVSWWLREGYQHLTELCPEVTYDIVGARPPAGLRHLAEGLVSVRVRGYVADATPFWTGATALVVPLLSGSGVRVKILEAMAMGVPVVSTSTGCEGLDVVDGKHLLIADSASDLASACARVIEDGALARRLATNARRLVEERYDAPVALGALDEAYEQVLNQQRVSAPPGV